MITITKSALPPGDLDASHSPYWEPFQSPPQMKALDDECCENTGQANECWEQDALADDSLGYIFCKTDADCGGGTCNMGPAVKTVLAPYPRITAAGYTGMCECSDHTDCRDENEQGGACFNFGDDGTGKSVGLCGPSMCNGFYICSCWGGCTWWDDNSPTNTPTNDAATIGLYCCENSKYTDPREDSGIVLFGNEDCVAGCINDAECETPNAYNPLMSDSCVSVKCNLSSHTCEYTPLPGNECDLDNNICTMDVCNSSGACLYDSPRVTPDTYGAGSLENTCTLDCVPSADNTSYTKYVPLSEPLDAATRPTTNACYEWNCVTSSGITYPAEQPVVCVDANTGDCSIPVCDPSGSQGNCGGALPITCSGTASLCNTPVCLDAIGGCAEVFDATQSGQTAACTAQENPLFSSLRPNCMSQCESTVHSTVATELEGACSTLYAVNDSCMTAFHLGDFTATNGIVLLDAKGSTTCATDQHESGNITCKESITGARMGHASPEAVYMFQYEPVDDGITDEYIIKVESSESAFDEALYVSIGADSCNAGAINSKDCDIYIPADATHPDKSHEDHCLASSFHPVSYDICESVDTSGVYNGGMGRSVVLEDTSDFSSGPITVYVYVEGNTEHPSLENNGDFYLSVTKLSPDGCPPISRWYNGTVRVPSVAPDGVPINGTNFPGFFPDTLTGSFGKSAPGVLLSGNTSDDADMYEGESGDGWFEWNSYDEAWRMNVQAATRFTASLCDFQSSVADTQFDTMLGLFNCKGERVIFNDDGSGLPYYPEGNSLCSNGKSHIVQTPTLNPDDGPYYLMVDGYYQPAVRGTKAGSAYDLAVYYNPFKDIDCDPNDPNGFGLVRSGSSGIYPDRATISFPDNQCVLLVDTNATDTIPGRTVQFHWDGGVQPASWECDHGAYAYCLPMLLTMTIIFENSSGDRCTQTIANWSDGDHGWYPGIYVPYSMTNIDGVTCDQFVGIAAAFEYSPTLTAAQLATCETQCATINLKFDG
ncbi:MAG: hypothetical protein JXR76_10060 [Deltaproteobacteria bacterium]|nr:hypothetical protein [Deltaproteobacteria bacterium]